MTNWPGFAAFASSGCRTSSRYVTARSPRARRSRIRHSNLPTWRFGARQGAARSCAGPAKAKRHEAPAQRRRLAAGPLRRRGEAGRDPFGFASVSSRRGIAKPPLLALRRCYARDRTSHRRRGSRELIYITNPSIPSRAALAAYNARRQSRPALAVNAPDPAPSASPSSATAAAAAARSHRACCARSSAKAGPAARCRRICWSASRRPTTPRSTGSTSARRSSRRPISSCRSSTIPTTSARSPRPTRSPTSMRWAATPLFALALVGMPVDKLPSDTIRRILEGGERSARRPAFPSPAATRSIRSSRSTDSSRSASSIRDSLKRNAGAQPGDALVLGKPLGVGIYSAALKKEQLPPDALRGDDREHDAAQHARHRARHDGRRARADRRHRASASPATCSRSAAPRAPAPWSTSPKRAAASGRRSSSRAPVASPARRDATGRATART